MKCPCLYQYIIRKSVSNSKNSKDRKVRTLAKIIVLVIQSMTDLSHCRKHVSDWYEIDMSPSSQISHGPLYKTIEPRETHSAVVI
jgi:hypothetical protein